MSVRRVLLLVVVAAVLLAGFGAWRVRDCLFGAGDFPARPDDSRLAPFGNPAAALTQADYAGLFSYFVEGFVTYRSPGGAGADYPGWPMGEGSASDRSRARLEGFSRIAPLLGGWLRGGRESRISLSSGAAVDVTDLLRTGILHGTDPSSADYWGVIDASKIVEAADIALALWLSRDALWAGLSTAERHQVADWLYGVNGKQTVDNNWHLFVVQVNVVLQALGMPADMDEAQRRYTRFKSFYAGDGWFHDGPTGHVDYYNAWGMHYPLYWIREISPQWDREFLVGALADFAAKYKYFFGPNGIPAMGRSLCYRAAAPVPLLMAAQDGSSSVSAGEARRALDLTWSFLVRNGAVVDGTMTQGYCGADPRILDAYSGPASCLWSLRSLVAAFSLPAGAALWQTVGEPLPVERGDFSLDIPAIGWRVVGDAARGDVTILIDANRGNALPRLQEYPWFRRISDAVLCRSRRPENDAAKYAAESYSSSVPFCGCQP